MTQTPIISVSGLRGVVGQSLTPVLAAKYVAAYAGPLPSGPLVITRDGRTTGSVFAQAVCSAVAATGHDVIYADVAATPTTGVLIRHHQAVGGIQISASHNPPEYNGLKLFGGDGRVISAGPGERVLQRFQNEEFGWCTYEKIGNIEDINDSWSAHLQLLLGIVDVDLIRSKQFKVVLDANHGAGSLLGRQLLDALGCEAVILGDTPDGKFAHPPEPTADNLTSVCDSVPESGAVVGFCQDPDADRLALIDETGKYIGEEYTVAICVQHILRQQQGPIVTNCSTSRMSQDIAEAAGVPFHRAKVGEANVADLMIAENALFGGEGNGGPIDPRIGYVRDSFVGMALTLEAMATERQPISGLVQRIPAYAIEKSKVTLQPERVAAALEALRENFSDAEASTLDGLRLDWPQKWLLVRASNTEPIVRLVVESEDAGESNRLCEAAAEILQRFTD